MQVKHVPCWEDNYAYVIWRDNVPVAFVDPVEPHKLLKHVSEHLSVSEGEATRLCVDNETVILTTHHHQDHSGGNKEARKLLGDQLKVYGFYSEPIPELNMPLKDNQEFVVGGLQVKALLTPPHTAGHLCYYVTDGQKRNVFTGDCLFIAGSGYINEGTPTQMHNSIVSKLAKLPDDTQVWVGHEYTKVNLQFAASIEPENTYIQQKLKEAQSTEGYVSIPSSIGQEKLINPYMRVVQQSVRDKVDASNEVDATAKIREMKNNWKP